MHPFFKKRRRIEEEIPIDNAPAMVNSEASANAILCTPEILTEQEKVSWPDVWTNEMWNEKKKLYPWLNSSNGKIGCGYCSSIKNLGSLKSQGAAISKEWASTSVCSYGSDRGKKLTSLRKKIFEHFKSDAHLNAVKILESAKEKPLEKAVDRQNRSEINETCKTFRTAYFIAKNDRPYSDHFNLLELQQLNGADIAHGLRSRFSATNIIDHVAKEMKLNICKRIIEINGKISILIDESTTLSSKTSLIVYMKCETDKQCEPIFTFLDLLELPSQDAKTITEQLLNCLRKYGFHDKYLEENLVAFTSDGASTMLGKKSGVAECLSRKFPNIVVWHCLNHRLELAVGDAINEVHGISHFQIFMDKLYSLYSRSPKNQREIKECAAGLETEIKKIGRVLGVRWVASSFRTVSAVWQNYEALHKHFQSASIDENRTKAEHSTFKGLLRRISSKQFLKDLALMHDVLFELSILSEALQNRNITIVDANKKIHRTIRFLESMSAKKGTQMFNAEVAIQAMKFGTIDLTDNQKLTMIHQGQFFASIVNNLQSRLLTENSETASISNKLNVVPGPGKETIVADLSVLDQNNWPAEILPGFGESEIKSLSRRFRLPFTNTLNAYRDFLDNGGRRIPDDLRPLINCSKVIPVSSSECERGFSHMNNIVSKTRSRLVISHVANLMFVKINGPPLKKWKPEEYVVSWLREHRSATDKQTRVAVASSNENEDVSENSLWKFL